jgi:hypothetical protein
MHSYFPNSISLDYLRSFGVSCQNLGELYIYPVVSRTKQREFLERPLFHKARSQREGILHITLHN